MKIRRYIAKDMRNALRQVRECQGEDAVILSSRRTPEGVEVVAAIDFDAEAAANGAVEATAAAAEPRNDFSQFMQRAQQHMESRVDSRTDSPVGQAVANDEINNE